MSFTFALFASRKGTQSVERGEGMLFISKGVIDIIFHIQISQIWSGVKMIAITPYFFGMQSCYACNGMTISIRGEGCYALSTPKAMREPEYGIEQ